MVQYMNNGFNQWNNIQNQKKPSKLSGFWLWLMLFFVAWWITSLFVKPQNVQQIQQNTINIEQSSSDVRSIDSEDIALDIQGLRLSNIELKQHKKESDKNVALLSAENNFVELGFISADTTIPNINTHWELKSDVMHFGKDVHFARTVSVDGYVIKVSDIITNHTKKEISIAPYARIIHSTSNEASGTIKSGGVVYANSKISYENWNRLNKKSFAYSSVKSSFGFAEQYWETIASMDVNDQTITLKKIGDAYVADANAAAVKIAPGENKEINTFIFAGPRQSDLLNAAAKNIPGIEKTMDYGWFWFLTMPMLWMINWLYDMVGNYGVAIILMTLILRILIWPLTRKSYTSSIAMQKMQPELQRVQKLYANDKARLQMEMMKIYQTHKTSPMSGCLPMLIQLPIFLALYRALIISVPMRSAQFLWISDLAAKDPYYILPILMGATMWLQQYLQTPKVSSNTNDAVASTQRVMKWMPVIFAVMFAWMPAGLILYWTVSNVFTIFQMYIIKKSSK